MRLLALFLKLHHYFLKLPFLLAACVRNPAEKKRKRYFAKRYAHLFAVHHAHVPSILRIPKSGVFPVAVNYHNAHPALFRSEAQALFCEAVCASFCSPPRSRSFHTANS